MGHEENLILSGASAMLINIIYGIVMLNNNVSAGVEVYVELQK